MDQGPLVDSTGPTCLGAMALSRPPCTGENVPAVLVRRVTSAEQLISRAASTSGEKKAKRLMRKGIKALKQAVRMAAKASEKGAISSGCAAAVTTEFSTAKAGADRWLSTP